MSLLSDALADGFGALLSVAGERLTLGSSEVITGIVNRKVNKIKDSVTMSGDGRKPDFSVLGMTEIEYFKAGVTQPEAGDVFTDAMNFKHRVRYVTHTGNTWCCYCQPSQSAA